MRGCGKQCNAIPNQIIARRIQSACLSPLPSKIVRVRPLKIHSCVYGGICSQALNLAFVVCALSTWLSFAVSDNYYICEKA